MNSTSDTVTPEDILNAYCIGLFPMADSALAPDFYWVEPKMRGQLPIQNFHIPNRLKVDLKQGRYDVTFNRAFKFVIESCAESAEGRRTTWINQPIIDIFNELHAEGYAHSIEAWHNNQLVGGIYGLAIGKAFFAESKFSRQTNASKVALCHLAARLWYTGYKIFDIQFINEHLKQFGAYEVEQAEYLEILRPNLLESPNITATNCTERTLISRFINRQNTLNNT